MLTLKEISAAMKGVSVIPEQIISQIHQERLLQIWVPKQYGGLGLRLNEGLQVLYQWSKINGSLGWMLTLCSGANFFSRNLKPEVAKTLFSNSKTCFGGSGMVGGTAEKHGEENFIINGTWHFATGAPHLSHFTLNAKVTENGIPMLDESGSEIIRSFVMSRKDVEIIPDWKSMGMKATGTYSFRVENVMVFEEYTFIYDKFLTDDVLDKIPFRIFADLTLLVNYLGMASRFSEEAQKIKPELKLEAFDKNITDQLQHVMNLANEVEHSLLQFNTIGSEKPNEIHEYSLVLVKTLSHQILEIYFQLGLKATHTDSEIYEILCDYFTATQHTNFRRNFSE